MKNLIFTVLTFVALIADAQVKNIELLPTGTFLDIVNAQETPRRIEVKNFPFEHLPFKSLRKVAYNASQERYEKVLDKISTHEEYRKFSQIYKADTSFVIPKKLPGNTFYIATAIDSSGFKYVAIDYNNDSDFRNDKILKFDLRDTTQKEVPFKVRINFFNGTSVEEDWVDMQLDPYKSLFTPKEYESIAHKNLDILISKIFPIYSGYLAESKGSYKIDILNYDMHYPGSKYRLGISRQDSLGSYFTYSPQDTVLIGYDRYKVANIFPNKLELISLGLSITAGAEVNSPAPEIESMDYINGQHFILSSLKGKYVLIDFWGSWCVPCIKALPLLKKIHEKTKHTVAFLSVALDYPNKKDELSNLIQEHQMDWHHVLDDRNVGAISKLYKVGKYPTSLLIDAKGTVVFRGVGENGLRDLEVFINALQLGR